MKEVSKQLYEKLSIICLLITRAQLLAAEQFTGGPVHTLGDAPPEPGTGDAATLSGLLVGVTGEVVPSAQVAVPTQLARHRRLVDTDRGGDLRLVEAGMQISINFIPLLQSQMLHLY